MNLMAKDTSPPPWRRRSSCAREFAGAADEMAEAFIVDPYDARRTVSTLERVLKLAPGERRERMIALYTDERTTPWLGASLPRQLHLPDRRPRARATPPIDADDLVAAVHDSKRRLFLLDYDGALVPFAPGLLDSAPSPLLVGFSPIWWPSPATLS